MDGLQTVATLSLPVTTAPVTLLRGNFPGSELPMYLVDSPEYFARPGNPYVDTDGNDWPDNALRFALFGRAVTSLSMGTVDPDWQPDLVHCNDWQSGLVPALLSQHPKRPASVFTIHNLAYQGLFSWNKFSELALPESFWSADSMEFYDQFSFIKGGLIHADYLTTVSPTYASEILRPEFSCGLDGLLQHRSTDLTGILNGVDYQVWSPDTDSLINSQYEATSPQNKAPNKAALQQMFGLPVRDDVLLLGHIGRLVEQKGVDLIIDAADDILAQDIQLVTLGTGNAALQSRLQKLSAQYPRQVGTHIGYNEPLAHQIEAGADAFLMPSRFEPCGLNQLYSLRYGTLPIVTHTGGLADSVVDASDDAMADGRATGFVMPHADVTSLSARVTAAAELFQQRPKSWKSMMRTAMQQDFGWDRSARAYEALYRKAVTA